MSDKDDPVIPFRVSHATDIATTKNSVKALWRLALVGIAGGMGLGAAILGALLMGP